jgi:cbb3-type cytochrome oxidase maturation protein
MTALAWLIPCALLLGLAGLAAFLWSLKSGQFEDLEGAGWRILEDEQPPDAGSRRSQVTGRDRADNAAKGVPGGITEQGKEQHQA